MMNRRQTVPDAREHPRREGLWPLFISREDLVEELLLAVTRRLPGALAELAMEDRLRLAGPERFAAAVLVGLRAGLWARVAAHLGAKAERQARVCPRGRRREAQARPVAVKGLGATTTFPCTYFYCRTCHLGDAPVAGPELGRGR